MEQPDDSGLKCRAGNGIDEPEQCKSRNSITDLRDELAPPEPAKITGGQEPLVIFHRLPGHLERLHIDRTIRHCGAFPPRDFHRARSSDLLPPKVGGDD